MQQPSIFRLLVMYLFSIKLISLWLKSIIYQQTTEEAMKKVYFPFFVLFLFFSVSLAQNEQLLYDGVDEFCNLPGGQELFSNLDVSTVEAWINSSDISNAPIWIGSGPGGDILFGLDYLGEARLAFGTAIFLGGSYV